MPRKVAFWIVTCILVVLVIELLAWVSATVPTRRGLHMFPGDLFAQLPQAKLESEAPRSELGWPGNDEPRPQGQTPHLPRCGSAFGDSMTRGSEVEPHETWIHELSQRFGCYIANYAMGAYGLDQAVLRYERIAPTDKLVILGLFSEMLRRQMGASWTFYAAIRPVDYSRIKPYFTLDGHGLRLHPIPKPLTRDAIAAHHANDYFMHHVWTARKFPYTLQVLRAGYKRVVRPDEYRYYPDEYWSESHPSGSGILARRLVSRFVDGVQKQNGKVALVLIPPAEFLEHHNPHYTRFVDDMHRRGDVCVIETQPGLSEQTRKIGPKALEAPLGHYNVPGNVVIADIVEAGLSRCGIAP